MGGVSIRLIFAHAYALNWKTITSLSCTEFKYSCRTATSDLQSTAKMNGASDFSCIVYLASAAIGVAGGIIYVARQLVTKEDLKEAKTEIEKVMVTKEDLKEAKAEIDKDLKKLEIKLESIEKILNGKK